VPLWPYIPSHFLLLFLLGVELTLNLISSLNWREPLDYLIILFIIDKSPIQRIAFHQGFILCGDLSGSNAIYAIRIVTHSNQKRCQQNAHIKAIAFLPS
jgi:hypothetical protein